LEYVFAKNYQNRAWSDKVIAKIKRCSFLTHTHSVLFLPTLQFVQFCLFVSAFDYGFYIIIVILINQKVLITFYE